MKLARILALTCALGLWLLGLLARMVFRLVLTTHWASRKAMQHEFDQLGDLLTPEGTEALRGAARQLEEDFAAALDASKLRASQMESGRSKHE